MARLVLGDDGRLNLFAGRRVVLILVRVEVRLIFGAAQSSRELERSCRSESPEKRVESLGQTVRPKQCGSIGVKSKAYVAAWTHAAPGLQK